MHIGLFGRKPWALSSLARGFQRHGDTSSFSTFKAFDGGLNFDAAFIMSWGPDHEEMNDKIKDKMPVFWITDGYIKRRVYGAKANYAPGVYFGISQKCPGGYGTFNYDTHPDDRWLRLGLPIPQWRPPGDSVLIGMQENPDVFGAWRNKYFKRVANYFSTDDRSAKMRVHPRFNAEVSVEDTAIYGFQGEIVSAKDIPLEDNLDGCDCLITYDSNVAVEAALLGYPVVEQGKSMAHPISTGWKNFVGGEKLRKKDLERWCHWIAYQQWTRADMENGSAWEYIKKVLLKWN